MNLKDVSAILDERKVSQNAMWMGEEVFGSVYRYMMRYLERYHGMAYKVLFTVGYTSTDIDEETKEEIRAHVKDILQESLRNSDILMQAGQDQFFLLLLEIDKNNIDRVITRIDNAWSRSGYNAMAVLTSEAESVELEHSASERDYRDYDWVAVVDDNVMNLQMAEHILKDKGIKVTKLKSGQELIDFMKDNRPDLILLDVMMPDMDGFETYKKLDFTAGDSVPVIFLTADENEETETKGLELGAMDFIKKPFMPNVLVMRVKNCIELIRLQNNLSAEVDNKTKENEKLFIHVVQSLADAIDAKDTYTNGHSGRVAEYAREIARRYGYTGKKLDDLYMMGLLHDVGKIGVPDAVINKPAKLTDEEFEMIKSHPVMGARILKNIKEMPGLAIGARWHHERFGGDGYPDGLKGDDIPEEARIIAVADAYDAMSSRRSYRDILPQNVVREEIERGKGTQFDPEFADIMLAIIDEDTEYNMREK